jgi:hypothetical protein
MGKERRRSAQVPLSALYSCPQMSSGPVIPCLVVGLYMAHASEEVSGDVSAYPFYCKILVVTETHYSSASTPLDHFVVERQSRVINGWITVTVREPIFLLPHRKSLFTSQISDAGSIQGIFQIVHPNLWTV